MKITSKGLYTVLTMVIVLCGYGCQTAGSVATVDPWFGIPKCKTFSIIRIFDSIDFDKLEPFQKLYAKRYKWDEIILERELKEVLINKFDLKYVKDITKSDIVFIFQFYETKVEKEIPEQTILFPAFVPGQRVITTGSMMGIPFHQTTYTAGTWDTIPLIIPPYQAIYSYCVIELIGKNPKDNDLVFSGNAIK